MQVRMDLTLEESDFGISLPVVVTGDYQKVTEFGDDGLVDFQVYAERNDKKISLKPFLSDYQLNRLQTELCLIAKEDMVLQSHTNTLTMIFDNVFGGAR